MWKYVYFFQNTLWSENILDITYSFIKRLMNFEYIYFWIHRILLDSTSDIL